MFIDIWEPFLKKHPISPCKIELHTSPGLYSMSCYEYEKMNWVVIYRPKNGDGYASSRSNVVRHIVWLIVYTLTPFSLAASFIPSLTSSICLYDWQFSYSKKKREPGASETNKPKKNGRTNKKNEQRRSKLGSWLTIMAEVWCEARLWIYLYSCIYLDECEVTMSALRRDERECFSAFRVSMMHFPSPAPLLSSPLPAPYISPSSLIPVNRLPFDMACSFIFDFEFDWPIRLAHATWRNSWVVLFSI